MGSPRQPTARTHTRRHSTGFRLCRVALCHTTTVPSTVLQCPEALEGTATVIIGVVVIVVIVFLFLMAVAVVATGANDSRAAW